MPKKINRKKTCKKSNKTTNSFTLSAATISGIIAAIGTTANVIWNFCEKYVKPAAQVGTEISKYVLAALAVGLGFMAPIIWRGVQYLSKTGFTALYNLMTELWKDAHKKTIKTDNIKKLIRDIKDKIATKKPDLNNSTIMRDINELTKTIYYIDNLNQEGMTKIILEDMKLRLQNGTKNLLAEFGKVMSKE